MLNFVRLTPALVDEFLYFFDFDAFPEGDEWAHCYCLEGHHIGEEAIKSPKRRREIAEKLVRTGKLTGYLIQDDGRTVGWVKWGDRLDFEGLSSPEYGELPQARGEVASIYCIDLIKEYQGKGIAKLALETFLQDAKSDGYIYAEAYPSADRGEHRNYRGHAGMYEEFGFECVRDGEWISVMQKRL